MRVFPLLQLIYWAFVALTCTVVWLRGRRDERLGAAIVVVSSLATIWAVSIPSLNFRSAQLGAFAIDLMVLAAFLPLALRSNRFWPLWVCGFHLVGVGTHVVTLFYQTILPHAYRLMRGFWAYPMMIAIMLGALTPLRQARSPAA